MRNSKIFLIPSVYVNVNFLIIDWWFHWADIIFYYVKFIWNMLCIAIKNFELSDRKDAQISLNENTHMSVTDIFNQMLCTT